MIQQETNKNKFSGTQKLKNYEFEGYIASSGEVSKGSTQAPDIKTARRYLLYQNITVTKVVEVKSARGRIKYKDITLFTNQLASMLKTGLPLTAALRIVATGYTKGNMTSMILDIKNQVEQGSSLQESLETYSRYFDSLYLGLIATGEASGSLDLVLRRIAIQREKNAKLKSDLIKVLTYPVFVVLVSITAIIFMLIKVLPIFGNLYKDFGAELPKLTRLLMAVSGFLIDWGWLILGVVATLVTAFVWSYRYKLSFQEKISRIIMKTPFFGSIVQQLESSRWARTFVVLYSAGIPITEALGLLSNSCKNIIFKNTTNQMQHMVSQGESLVYSMHKVGNNTFPSILVQLIETGEEVGTLEEMFNKAADYLDETVDVKIGAFESVFGPIVVVVLAIIVGVILVAMYLPIINVGSIT